MKKKNQPHNSLANSRSTISCPRQRKTLLIFSVIKGQSSFLSADVTNVYSNILCLPLIWETHSQIHIQRSQTQLNKRAWTSHSFLYRQYKEMQIRSYALLVRAASLYVTGPHGSMLMLERIREEACCLCRSCMLSSINIHISSTTRKPRGRE